MLNISSLNRIYSNGIFGEVTGVIGEVGGLFAPGGTFGPKQDDPIKFQAYLDQLNGKGHWGSALTAYEKTKDNSVSSLNGHLDIIQQEALDVNMYEFSKGKYVPSKQQGNHPGAAEFQTLYAQFKQAIQNEKNGIVVSGNNVVTTANNIGSQVTGMLASFTSNPFGVFILLGLLVYLFMSTKSKA